MTLDIPESTYRQIEEQISSADSPVGIDARKTHVLILHKLMEIERRLTRLEERLEAGDR
jgi:hypothetical protein